MQTHVPTQAGGWMTPVPPTPVDPACPVTTTMLPLPVAPATPGLPVLAELPGLPVPVGWPLPTVPVQAADPATNNPTRILPMERVIWFALLPAAQRNRGLRSVLPLVAAQVGRPARFPTDATRSADRLTWVDRPDMTPDVGGNPGPPAEMLSREG